jgi:sulfide:quinone oxidoreductase
MSARGGTRGVEEGQRVQPSSSRVASGERQRPREGKRVVICGGGVAAVEALLALRVHVKIGLQVHLVAPNDALVYQPLAVAAPFDLAETTMMSLAHVARDQHARLHVDSLLAVDAKNRCVRLTSEAELPYDALLVAVGAHRRDWLDGALHFGGASAVDEFRSLLADLAQAGGGQVSFVVPRGTHWSLPVYELALLTASHAADQGLGVELTLVTPERAPLTEFGPAAGRALRDLLSDRGIALKTGSAAKELRAQTLHLDSGASVEADHVVTLPRLVGPRLDGLPHDPEGFIPVDEHSRVAGVADVYAAGDATSFPIKQGGIATQQADAAAGAIAAKMGAPGTPSPLRAVLRGMLLTGIAPVYMRASLGASQQDSATAMSPLWSPPAKIAARYLAPYLAGRSKLAQAGPLQDRPASGRDPALLDEAHAEARKLALVFAERDAKDGHLQSALEWLEVIERLDGMLPPGYLHKRTDWLARAERARVAR